MKKRYELQYRDKTQHYYSRSIGTDMEKTLNGLKERCVRCNESQVGMTYRVVQKLGRKVIKVIYPKGK